MIPSFYSLSGNYVTALGHVKLLYQHTFRLFWQSKIMRMRAELLKQLESLNTITANNGQKRHS